MSDFLSNLAARSLGSLETIRPRVPSRFEPVRGVEGRLSARTPPMEEGMEVNREAGGTEGDEASSAMDPAENHVRAARPTDRSARQPGLSPSSAESLHESLPAWPAAHPTAGAGSPGMPSTANRPDSQAMRIPGNESAGPSTHKRRTVAETVMQPEQHSGHAPGFESPQAATGKPQVSTTDQARETNEGAIQSRTGRGIGFARTLRSLGANAPDSGFVVSPTVGSRAPTEQASEKLAQASFAAFSRSEIEPLVPSSQAAEVAGNDEAQGAQIQTGRQMPTAVAPAHTGGVFPKSSRRGPGATTEDATDWPSPTGALNLNQHLRPDLSIGPVPRQETAAPAQDAELASPAPRPTAANPPASQTSASGAPEPEIRVTIGRVEVRAVFPEQPGNRSAAPRFRPSVTLDDYLARGSGANR
jgi:hypothetical protein